MSEFVDECRREWKRLGVPDPIANEMAVDLSADIAEAEAEGGSAEDVLGDSFFDARRFAASWAGARGVIGPTPPVSDPPRRLVPAIALGTVAPTSLFGRLSSLSVDNSPHRPSCPGSSILPRHRTSNP